MEILSIDTLPTSLSLAAGFAAKLRLAAGSVRRPKSKVKRLIEAAKKEGKVVYWDAGGSAKEWEQLFNKFRLKYPFLRVEHWRATSDAEV